MLQLLLQFRLSPGCASAFEQSHCCPRLAHIPTRRLPSNSCANTAMFPAALDSLPHPAPGPDDVATWLQSGALFGALGVIALGTGGIKPNVSAFGADQFDEKDPQDKKEKESFFNWFYLAINIGRCVLDRRGVDHVCLLFGLVSRRGSADIAVSFWFSEANTECSPPCSAVMRCTVPSAFYSLIACTVIVYVQDTISWTVGFALPASAMASAVLLFLAGSKHYR